MKNIVGRPSALKRLNKDTIEDAVRHYGPVSKQKLSKITNLSLVTVNKTVEKLLEENKVVASGFDQTTGGRPSQLFEVNTEHHYYLGLYYYKDTYIGAVSNSIGEIIYNELFMVHTENYENVMKDTYHAIDKLIEFCGEHEVAALGLAVPGVVNNGLVTMIPTISSFENKMLGIDLEKKYGFKVYLENDINVSTMGIFEEEYKDTVENLALIYLEQGIGGSMIVNKRLIKGFSNFAGEIGHITIGSKGSKLNIEDRMNELNNEITENTRDLSLIIEDIIELMIPVLVNIICIINPEVIIIRHSNMTMKDTVKIKRIVASQMSLKNTPDIVLAVDLSRRSIQGVIDMCVTENNSSYFLSNRKW